MSKLKNEHILAIILVGLVVVFSVINPAFFSIYNFMDVIRSSIITGVFSMGVMLVMLSGGIDISFPAIAAFSMYSTSKIVLAMDYQGNMVFPILLSCLIGLGLGLFNGFLIWRFNLPTLIVTIGTANLYQGILLTFVGSRELMQLPKCFTNFSKSFLVSAESVSGISSIPMAVFAWIAVIVICWYVLTHTTLGRGIYALGGNATSAERIGFNIMKIKLFVYGFAGAAAGLAGIMNSGLKRMSNPFDLLGIEMTILAAVVLGGVSISGGRGSVWGTIMGVLILTIISTSLVLLGVSTYWQRAVIGLLLLAGTAITALRNKAVEKAVGS